MRLLILGGTLFLGRHLTEAALARGHEVTLFNRGRTDPEAFPEVERLRGDRDGGLEVLRGRRWDAAIDTSGYVPRVVRESAALLAGSVGLYVFVSTVSVYADFARPVDEDSPLATLADESVEEVNGGTYGPLKALCERAAEAEMPGRVLVVRPGLIVGPHDSTVRFSYWTARLARGGEVLAPGNPEAPVQLIDARDLAEWVVRMAEEGRAGVFNAAGPDYPLTMRRLLEECRAAAGTDATLTWVGDEFLLERNVEPWGGLPLWLPESSESHRYFLRVSVGRALARGLAFRPLAETARDTLAWQRGLAGPPRLSRPDVTLRPERERELLAEWEGSDE